MFGEIVRETPVTYDWCSPLFKNIICPDILGDLTLKAVLNILVSPRLLEDENFTVCYRYPADTDSPNNLFIIKDANTKDLKEPEGFKTAADLSMYLSKYEPVKVFINEEKRQTFVLGSRLQPRVLHLTIALISRLLPWIFKEKPLSSEERNFIKTLTLEKSNDFYDFLHKYAEKMDSKKIKIEYYLKDIEKNVSKRKLEAINRTIENIQRNLRTMIDNYNLEVKRLDEANLQAEGYLFRLQNPSDNALMNYFVSNDCVDLTNVSNGIVYFTVDTFLDNFDCRKYQTVSGNMNSVMYTRQGSDFFKEGIKRKVVFDELFHKIPRIKVKMCASFEFDIQVGVDTNISYPPKYSDHIPNPHIHHNGCLGNNYTNITEYQESGDMIAAVEACVAAAKNCNIAESASFGPFVGDFFRDDKKCVVLPDGSSCTPSEAYEWIINNPREE